MHVRMSAGPRSGTRGLRKTVAAGMVAFAAFAVAGTALAQAGPTVSPPTREEIERGVREGTLERQGAPVSVDTGAVERAPCPLASPDFAGIRLKVESVAFSGVDKIPEVDLSQSYRPYIGTDQPVAVICEIRDRAATQLRAAGYLAAVQVPPQTIESGSIKLDVLLARMSKVQVKGDAGPSEKLLVRYISKLTQDVVFNTRKAERYLLLARDIPGLDIRLALRPIEGSPGEVVGEVTVRRNPVYADLTAQNLGSRSVGRWSGLGRVQLSGLTGLGDATTASIFTTADFDEQVVLQAGHEFRVGGEGLTFRGDFTYGWTRPTIANNPNIESRTLIASLEAAYPFLRAQAQNLSGAVGFDLIEQDVDFGAFRLNKDKLRVAFVRLDANGISRDSIAGRDGFTALEPNWSWAASIEARQGLDVFGASPDCGGTTLGCIAPGAPTPSRIDGDPTAFVLRGAGEIDWRPVRNLTFSLAPRAQYAPHALLSYEEYSGGNYTVGRGYDPGAIIGDSGIGVRSEVRVGSLLPRTAGGFAFQPYAFFDYARVWNEDASFNGVGGQQLYSAGAGVRASIRDAARLDAVVAVPLRNAIGAPNAKGDVRVLVNLTVQLAPWRW